MARSPIKRENLSPGLHCSVEDQRRLLGASPYFKSLDASQIDQVQRQFGQSHFTEGSTIHLTGQPAARLSIVAAGSVKLVRSAPDGKDVLVDLLTPGDHFGSLADLGDATYRETAIAHSECCVLSTTASDFSRMLQQYPSVALDALGIVAARLRDARGTIEQLSAYPVEHRVITLLLQLSGKIGVTRADDVLIDLPLSRQDIADMTGTTVESVSRVMSDLRKEGMITSGRRWIAIPDVAKLEERIS